MRKSALFGEKFFEFFEIYGVPARTKGEGGLSSANKGGGGGEFCAVVFYGRPLR